VSRSALVALSALLCFVWLLPAGDSGVRIPLSIPVASAERPTWDQQSQSFSDRLVRGYDLPRPVADEFAEWILEASVRQQLEPELIASLVMAESSFRKHARSSVGAVGPAQVQPDLWRDFCGTDVLDPEENVYCGAQILAHYRDACGRDLEVLEEAEACALRSYNAGFENRDNRYFERVHQRYAAKIDRYRDPLNEA